MANFGHVVGISDGISAYAWLSTCERRRQLRNVVSALGHFLTFVIDVSLQMTVVFMTHYVYGDGDTARLLGELSLVMYSAIRWGKQWS